jgi:xanthine/uracil permease
MEYQQILQKYQVILATQYSIPGIVFGFMLYRAFEEFSFPIFLNSLFWAALSAILFWVLLNKIKKMVEEKLTIIQKEIEKL